MFGDVWEESLGRSASVRSKGPTGKATQAEPKRETTRAAPGPEPTTALEGKGQPGIPDPGPL